MDERTQLLLATIRKLYTRGARHNIQKILVKSHTADVADVMESLKPDEAIEIFRMEPSLEKRANLLSYVSDNLQDWLLDKLERAEAIKLLSLMDRDDAADILGRLPDDQAREMLQAMQREDSEDVADLMAYPDDSAGGLMDSDFLALHQSLTVKEAITAIQTDEEDRVLFYIYVVNDSGSLVGVMSLKQLLLSRQNEKLKDLMTTAVISVTLDVPQEQVARTVERYDFLSIPVVDDTNKLMGVITVDDVIDVIREEAEEDLMAMGQAGYEADVSVFEHFKARIPWLILAWIGGALCFGVVYLFGQLYLPEVKHLPSLWLLAAFIPLLLSVGTTAGTQSATVAVGILRSDRVDRRRILNYFRKEFILALLFSLLFGGGVFLVSLTWFYHYQMTFVLTLAFFIQTLVAMSIGTLVPALFYRSGLDPSFAPLPVFTVLADVSAVLVLFGLFYAG